MAFETLMAMHVKDETVYRQYREKMMPLMAKYGGGFRYDFVIDEVLKSEAPHQITRVFAIYFKDESSREAFFADPAYKAVREEYFDRSVGEFTAIASYTR